MRGWDFKLAVQGVPSALAVVMMSGRWSGAAGTGGPGGVRGVARRGGSRHAGAGWRCVGWLELQLRACCRMVGRLAPCASPAGRQAAVGGGAGTPAERLEAVRFRSPGLVVGMVALSCGHAEPVDCHHDSGTAVAA